MENQEFHVLSAFRNVLFIMDGGYPENFDVSSGILSYHWLPKEATDLVMDNREFVSGVF